MLIIIVGILVTLMIIGAVVTASLAIRNRRLKKMNDIDMIRSTGVTPSTDHVNHFFKLTNFEMLLIDIIVVFRMSMRSPRPSWRSMGLSTPQPTAEVVG